ncbi:hypothetical protein AB6N24_08670 [Cellulomonas sp. 179-A 4D5 NHS]|uniref:hypothetical protein n=1 Tax=Cellulomonas sp. 179-A 4D5 NHS TaxID=3142378 RepID=UPI0039A2E8C9
MSTPAPPTPDPPAALALAIALADLQYLHSALIRPNDPTSGWLFVQWAVMTSYEARPHIAAAIGVKQSAAAWDVDMATAARMAGKFFDDKKRTIEDLADYFDRLRARNREQFFPADRPFGRTFDFLRTDLSVLLYDDIPITTSIGGFFSIGASPDESLASTALGPRLAKLTEEVGRLMRQLNAELTHAGPVPFEASRFAARDVNTGKLSDTVFEGMFDTAMALAMLTIQGSARAAHHLSHSTCCALCVFAALKHRYVVAYQALVSLRRLRTDSALPPSARTIIDAVLDTPECAHMLTDGYRRLRNGWLHLGLSDVPHDGNTLYLSQMIEHYTGGESVARVVAVTDTALGVVATALDEWCMRPKIASKPLASILHVPH